MARILGVEIPNEKGIGVALTYIYGIGNTTAQKILDMVNIDPNTRVKDLDEQKLMKIAQIIEESYKVEGELKQDIFKNIKRLKDIKSYRGLRHKLSLPVRGQNTRTNAVTRKGKNIAVGGLKRKIEKT
ncbi:30S ribosomal protein S13 [Candidatus Dojkabacteria bacterium]|nr:30S ribosomal protein S13 [Candidatus Dojkabacteria bacterium]